MKAGRYHWLFCCLCPRIEPSGVNEIRGIDGDLLQFDEEDGEFFTDYLDRFSVEIKAESLHTNADYIEIELPHMPEAAPIGAEFVRSVVNRVPYHKHVGQEAGEWLTEKWGSTIRTKRFGKVCVRIETYKGRAVLIRITGD